MLVLYITITALVAMISASIYIFKTSRTVDIITFVFNVMLKTGLLRFLHKTGLDERMRPKCCEIETKEGHRFIAPSPVFAKVVEEFRGLKIREDDIFVITYPKAGTTWLQEIVWLLCNNADVEAAKKEPVYSRVPFLETIDLGGDIKGIQTIENWPKSRQRLIKSHLPYEVLPCDIVAGKECKIIYLARNPKDLCVSYYFFHSMNIGMPNPGTWSEFLSKFCKGTVGFGSWFEHNLTYWKKFQEKDERIYFTTYENLKTDFRTEVRKLAKFMGKELTEERLEIITEHCSFKSMSGNESTNYSGVADWSFDLSKSKFMRKGQVGDWKNHFTLNENDLFDALYEKEMVGSGLALRFGP